MSGKASAVIAIVVIVLVVAAGFYVAKRSGEESASTASYTVRAATLQGGISTLDIIEDQKLMEKHGYNLEVLRLQKTPNILQALVKNDTDLAVIPAEMAARLIQDGENITIVAVDMLQNQAILVRGDSTIQSPEDLKGKLVGAVVASGTYKVFKAYMKTVYNITVVEGEKPQDGVITVLNVPPGSILDALKQGDVDAVVIWEPFVSLGVSEGMRILVSYSDLWRQAGLNGDPVMLVWVARADFALKHPDALKAFLAARNEAARMWISNETLVLRVLSSLYNLPEDAGRIMYERTAIVTGNLTDTLVRSIRSEWWLAWQGGYLASDPGTIGDTVFYRP